MGLQDRQKAFIAQYVEATFPHEGVFNMVNPLFGRFRQLVLALPGCDDLTEADVLNIAADILYKVHNERGERLAARPLFGQRVFEGGGRLHGAQPF